MARPEPIVIPATEGPRLVEIRQSISRAYRHIALHEAEIIKANGRPSDDHVEQCDGSG